MRVPAGHFHHLASSQLLHDGRGMDIECISVGAEAELPVGVAAEGEEDFFESLGHGRVHPRMFSRFCRKVLLPEVSQVCCNVRLKRALRGATILSLPRKRTDVGTA